MVSIVMLACARYLDEIVGVGFIFEEAVHVTTAVQPQIR